MNIMLEAVLSDAQAAAAKNYKDLFRIMTT